MTGVLKGCKDLLFCKICTHSIKGSGKQRFVYEDSVSRVDEHFKCLTKEAGVSSDRTAPVLRTSFLLCSQDLEGVGNFSVRVR